MIKIQDKLLSDFFKALEKFRPDTRYTPPQKPKTITIEFFEDEVNYLYNLLISHSVVNDNAQLRSRSRKQTLKVSNSRRSSRSK